jgi:membrane-bound ClpP family serine protease
MGNIKSIFTVLAIVLAMLMAATTALAQDKVELVDGRVFEGEILRELEGFIWIRARIGGIEQEFTLTPGEIRKIVRGEPAEATKEVAAATPKPGAGSQARSGAPRVAIISLGENPDKSTVGLYVTAESLRRIIPTLKAEGVQTVVFHVDSPGGLVYEVQRVSDVIHNEYKREFRVVAWVRSAISAAAMISHTIEEIYFMPQADYGAATAFSGALQAARDRPLEDYLAMMERISRRGGYHPAIMRSMQIMEPLSATIDQNGDVHWSNTLDGDHIVNPEGRVLTFTADTAIRFKFARGEARDHHELARLMGYTEVDWVGRTVRGIPYPVSRAEEELRKFRDDTYRDETQTNRYIVQYNTALANAQGRPRDERGPFLGRANNALDQIERMVRNNENLGPFVLGILPVQFRDWMEEQRKQIRDLSRR